MELKKADEISGKGNHYTVLFGEYDPRIIYRWNTDPKPDPSISPYAMFKGNPIWYSDILLDSIGVSWFSKDDGAALQSTAARVGDGKNDGVFLLFAHGNSKGVQYEQGGKKYLAADAESFNKIMSSKSKEWQTAMKDGKKITLVMYSCNTGANEYYDIHFGRGKIKVDKTIAQQISEAYKNVTVIAPDGYSWSDGEKIAGVQRTTETNKDGTADGDFITIKDGKKVAKKINAYIPATGQTKTDDKKKLDPITQE